MHSDSEIISFTTSSLSSGSVFEAEFALEKKTHSNSDEKQSKTPLLRRIHREFSSFCCVINYLTIKSCKFHSVKFFMFFLSLLALFTQMIIGGYLAAIITSLQTQYNLSTSKIGIVISSFDIMGVFATPLVSYWGSRFNKPRIIAVCGFVYVCGSVVFILPYFISDKYTITLGSSASNKTSNLSNHELCQTFNSTGSEVNCSRYVAQDWPYYLFIGGQLLMSWGIAPLFSLGVTYICDNSEERSHAVYTGIIHGAFALGPAIGYGIASLLLSKWLYLNETPLIDEKDPRWVGCWFMGFIISSFFITLASLVLLTFPESIRNKAKRKKEKSKVKNKEATILPKDEKKRDQLYTIHESAETMVADESFDFLETISQFAEMSDRQKESSTESSTESSSNKQAKKTPKSCIRLRLALLKIKGFFKSFLLLIMNFRYTLLILILSIECILVSIFSHYMILYSQNIFLLSSSRASILVGGVIVPSAIVGALFGGYLVKRFNLDIEGCTRLLMLSSALVLVGIFVLLFVRCPGSSSRGIDVNAQTFNKTFDACNSKCNCQSNYFPVCGSDQVSYVSPCYAGCKFANDSGFFECSCLMGGSSKNGLCPRDCDLKLIIFLIILFVVVAFEGLCLSPITILLLKLVDKPLQPFALGVMRMANILIAYIPAPIVLAQIIDKSCILWNKPCEGDKGSCLEYNVDSFHYVLFGASVGVKVVSCILLVVFSLYIHKSFVLKKRYTDSVELNHEIGSVLNPKQKYKLDSHVASLDSSISSSTHSNSSSKFVNRIRKLSSTKSGLEVVLQRHVSYDRDFTPIDQLELSSNSFTKQKQPIY